MDDLEYQIARLSLAPGDVLVFKVPGLLSTEQATRARDHLRRIAGTDQKVMILDCGADLAVLTVAEIEARIAATPNAGDPT